MFRSFLWFCDSDVIVAKWIMIDYVAAAPKLDLLMPKDQEVSVALSPPSQAKSPQKEGNSAVR